jgi:glycyl-tRNA synthetase
MAKVNEQLANIVALSKQRGFIYPSSEIYGGMANTYDFGPYGTELKNNVRALWWKTFISSRDDNYGIDSSIIMNPKIWESSGHVANFADIMVEDTVNQKRYRADHLIEEHYEKKGEEIKVDGKSLEEIDQIIKTEGIKSPDGNELNEPRKFDTLFKTEVGILEDGKNTAYLRGEIAQGLFLNFKNIMDSMHPKLPFGIGQVGKAFRNEITKGQFTFRTLEFDLMEFEYFFDPETQDWNELFEYWKEEIYKFTVEAGIEEENLRWRPHEEFELSHYSDRTEDLEYKFPWGFREMFACAYRTDFDLKNHEENSGKTLQYRSDDGRKFTPHVIEPTFGLSRFITILLMDAYKEEEVDGQKRVYLKFAPKIAPVKCAVFPLTKDDKLQSIAQDINNSLKSLMVTEYSATGSIGKRYRKQDEIGTPYCITVDFDSLDDKMVTIRDRDTLKQERIAIEEVKDWIEAKVK